MCDFKNVHFDNSGWLIKKPTPQFIHAEVKTHFLPKKVDMRKIFAHFMLNKLLFSMQ